MNWLCPYWFIVLMCTCTFEHNIELEHTTMACLEIIVVNDDVEEEDDDDDNTVCSDFP
jgi:hypothetical protein